MNPVSTYNTILTKEYLTNKPENQYFERKGLGDKDIKPSKISEELIGMLNADGGMLVFGISDQGVIQDISTLTNLDAYRTVVYDFIHPACTIFIEEITIDNNLIFVYHVEPELERIFSRKDNEQTFLRVLDTNRKLNRDGYKKLEYDKTIRKFEDETVIDFDVNDLDVDLLNSYKERLNYTGDILDLLVKRHLAKKDKEGYCFKKSAVLLFAKDPEKYIPSASVRYIRYQGTEALVGSDHNVIKDERFENNILRLVTILQVFLKTSFKDYYFLDLNEGRFKKVAEYPEDAWLEGVVNALCHRSYNIQGNCIYIKHFDDRIEISNSGPLPAQVTIENIKTERFARNPRIARVLEDMGYVRQLNEGVSRIYASMEKSMLALPEYKEVNNNIYLTLRNTISNHSKTIRKIVIDRIENDWGNFNETQRKILHYLFVQQEATKSELAEYCAIHINSISRNLNLLIDRNIIERVSEKQRDPNATYIFKKETSSD